VGFSVPDAHLLALHAHEGQVDKQGRDYYLAHLRPIAEALRPYGPEAEMAGALHDIVEDTRDHPDPERRYDLDRLRALGVPEVVVEAVDAVTRRPGEPYISGLIRRSAAHPLGRLVKLADNKHNLAANAQLAAIDPDKARSLLEGRYRPARRILLAAEAGDTLHGRRILA
jgi:(p)ppGpp synthase/HD superfamily hydrolase